VKRKRKSKTVTMQP